MKMYCGPCLALHAYAIASFGIFLDVKYDCLYGLLFWSFVFRSCSIGVLRAVRLDDDNNITK